MRWKTFLGLWAVAAAVVSLFSHDWGWMLADVLAAEILFGCFKDKP